VTAPAPYRAIWTYADALADRGLPASVSRLVECGITHVSVATAYHPVEALILGGVEPAWLSEMMSVDYLDGPAAPGVRAGGAGVVKAIRSAAIETGLEFSCWLVLNHTSIATARPDLAAQLVGGRVHRAALCPSNPEARQLVLALVRRAEDQLRPAVVDLESLGWNTRPVAGRVKVGVRLTDLAEYLVSLCRCERCLDGDMALGAQLERWLDDELQRETDRWSTAEFLDANPGLAALQARREEVVIGLASEIRGITSGAIHVVHSGRLDIAALDLERLATVVDRMTVLAYSGNANEIAGVLSQPVATFGADRVVVGLTATYPELTSAAAWQAQLHAAAAVGVRSWSAANLSLITSRRLGWIRPLATAEAAG
jgi:hypothetical protein